MATYWFNPSGSNTAPYDTKAKGATSFATLDTLFANGDVCKVADGAHTFTAQIHLFAGNTNLGNGHTFTLESESGDPDLCSLTQTTAETRLLLMTLGSETTPDDLGCDVTVRGIKFVNNVATGATRGMMCNHTDVIRNVTYEDCIFEFSASAVAVNRPCIDFTETDENRVATFTRCHFGPITLVNTGTSVGGVINHGSTTSLVLTDCTIGAISANALSTEYPGVFIATTTNSAGITFNNLKVVGPVVVTAGAAGTATVRGILGYSKSTPGIVVNGADITGITYDGSLGAGNVTGMAFYTQDNTTTVISDALYYGNRATGDRNNIGGLLCVKYVGATSTAIVQRSKAYQNEGFYGNLVYTTTGGGVTVKRSIARNNKSGTDVVGGVPYNGLGIYMGGGNEDCTLDSVLCYGHDIGASAEGGASIFGRNSTTAVVQGARTITMRHVTTFGDTATDAGDGSSVSFQQSSAAGDLTVNMTNCAFRNPRCTYEIATSSATGNIAMTLNNCALPSGATDIDAPLTTQGVGAGGSLTLNSARTFESGEPSAEGYPPVALLNRGTTTSGAVPTDVDGRTWLNATTPTVGARELMGSPRNRSRARVAG